MGAMTHRKQKKITKIKNVDNAAIAISLKCGKSVVTIAVFSVSLHH